jgi:predicted ribosome quality control (RQC) complex YloA/Tae2 family protein
MKQYHTTIQDRNFIINVGQNAKENWEIIDDADDFDLWFHVDDKPSGHVVIKEVLNNKQKSYIKNELFGYPAQLITIGAEYCKQQSKNKTIHENQKVSIIYTTIDNIKKGKDIGSVIIKNIKYIKNIIL